MGVPPKYDAPDNCTAISLECPVEGTTYGYYPSLGWNAFFVAWFGLAAIINLLLGIRYKTWTYMIAIFLGAAGECAGYVGRIMMHNNPWDDTGFQIQIVLLIFSPAFLAAGIYLTLKHVVINFGEEWSRLKPAWYTYIFIACDISSLVMQSAGGGIAATAEDGDQSTLDAGTNIMIAGIVWQVVVLVIFAFFVVEYSLRTYKRKDILSQSALALWARPSFKLFCGAVIVAYFGILIRCVYRIPELVEGWGSDMMRNEPEFIALEGVMIAITVCAQTVFHPGFCFPALANTIGQKKNRGEKSLSESDQEVMDRNSV